MLTSGAFGYIADYFVAWLLFASLVVHTWCFLRFFPWRRRRRIGLIVGNGLILACLLGVAALAGESYLRFACVRTDAFGASLPSRRWFALHTKLNSLGCRDREWTPEKPPGTRRIAFVGDSFTYGWGVERVEDRFAGRISAMFEAVLPGRVEVMNVAKPGWGTREQIKPIETMIETYGVDEIVLCYVFNDIESLIPVTDDFNPTRPPEPKWFNPDSSCLLDYLYRCVWAPRVATVRGYSRWLAGGYDDPRIGEMHRRDMDEISELCRDRGVRLRVVLLPFIRIDPAQFPARRLHEKVRDDLASSKVPALDLLPTLNGIETASLVVNRIDAHPNEKAHRLFAEAIWKAFYAAPEL